MSMMQAPVLRGSFKDSLPSDLKELATWLNYRLRENERPKCHCGQTLRVAYAPKSHGLLWGCPHYKRCGAKPREVDQAKVYKYAKSRLRHNPKNCFRGSYT
jgi:hypothetical protein